MNRIKTSMIALFALGTLGGCATTDEPPTALEQVRSEYERLASQPYVQRHAAQQLNTAEQAVDQAENVWESDADQELVDHHIYLAERRVAIAEEAAELGRAEQMVQNAEAERRQVLLSIREAQAQRAQRRAEQAQTEAEMARARAEQAEMRAQELEQSLTDLQSQVSELNAKQTREGIVLTLQDILFSVNEAELASGSDRTLDKVAEFLNEYEDRRLEIKGYTDATGSDTYNLGLSERRAQTVKDALVERGVDPNRITTEGYGEQSPVASNDTSTGRQQNRRVEILVQNPEQQQQQQEQVSALQ